MRKDKTRKPEEINPLIRPNGWKYLRVCQKCMNLVKEGEKCKVCGTVWEDKR